MTAGSSELQRYLGTLYARAPLDSYVEVRWRTANGMAQEFLLVAELHRAQRAIAGRGESTDVYVGVIPRRRRSGGRTALIDSGDVVWIDCDTAHSVQLLARFPVPPSVLVRSGTSTNRHAYWLLADPEPVTAVEFANRMLSAALCADERSADAARILRPPGTRNHKRGRATRVRLDGCEPSVMYPLTTILKAAGVESPSPGVPDGRTPRTADDPLLIVPPAVYVERLTGLTVTRSRKIPCPFHDDKSPSLHVYRSAADGWYCFGCRRGGSIYDFAAGLWRMPTRGPAFLELVDRLERLFSPDDLSPS